MAASTAPTTVVTESADHYGVDAALAAKEALKASLLAIMAPSVQLTAQVESTVATQKNLSNKLAELSAKLNSATNITPEDRDVMTQVEAYAAKVRAAKRRVAALQQSLEASQTRLVRVHAHLRASATAMEKRNADTEKQIEAMLPEASAPIAE